jgi:uncharacterized protein
MLKRFFVNLLLFSIMWITPLSAQNSPLTTDNLSLPRVIDEVGFLSAQEKAELERRITYIREQYAFDLVIMVINDAGNKSAEAYADDYYDYTGYGIGPNADGAMLLQVVNSRDIHISGTGNGEKIFNYQRINNTLDMIIPYLQRDDNFGAYKTFLDRAEYYLSTVEQDTENQKETMYFVSPLLALALSLITFFSFRAKHKTVRPRYTASEYLKQGSLRFTVRNDVFLSTFTSRTKRSSSGGSHTGSSGRSHSGGGRRY